MSSLSSIGDELYSWWTGGMSAAERQTIADTQSAILERQITEGAIPEADRVAWQAAIDEPVRSDPTTSSIFLDEFPRSAGEVAGEILSTINDYTLAPLVDFGANVKQEAAWDFSAALNLPQEFGETSRRFFLNTTDTIGSGVKNILAPGAGVAATTVKAYSVPMVALAVGALAVAAIWLMPQGSLKRS